MPMQFSNPVLTYSRFELNPDFIDDGQGLQAKIHINHAARRSKQENTADVAIRLQINQKGEERIDDTPFWLEIEYTALFSWTDDMAEEEVERYLRINASAMLRGYIRPLAATLTSASPFPTYTLPFINVSDLFKQK